MRKAALNEDSSRASLFDFQSTCETSRIHFRTAFSILDRENYSKSP